MNSNEIRSRFLNFIEKRGHAILPSAPLVPENDPSVLFNTAGMQPLVPYLMGQKHPKGTRLANAQKCVRTGDIEEVGDNTHHTFFEMLGNWSLGDYFKEDAINWSYEFLTSKEEGLGLDPNRLYVTVFEGDENAPKDNEAFETWKKLIPENRIYFMGADSNWWSPGDNGPCGPDSEMFYDRTENGLGGMTKEEYLAADDRQDVVEIWNDVFMEYQKTDGKVTGKLENKNVDTGSGFERVVSIIQGTESAYETDLFSETMDVVSENSTANYADNKWDMRVVADHLRTSVFMISDGVFPSNKDQGYILRRLIRRSVVKLNSFEFNFDKTSEIIDGIIDKYSDIYLNLSDKRETINSEINKEVKKFQNTLKAGLKRFSKLIDPETKDGGICKMEFGQHGSEGVLNEISGEDAFELFTSLGFPLELIKEEALKNNLTVDEHSFHSLLKEHQEKSRTASAGKFKGGLGGDSPKITAYHTATHLLLAGLKKHVGEHVHQAGSNITDERARFDFTNEGKVERDVLDKVEQYVNDAISKNAVVKITEMNKQEAIDSGVEGSFWEKYPDVVTVYTITDDDGTVYSNELCGGPHVQNTENMKEFGDFKIKKESSSSAGIRRIKAIFK